MGTFASRQKPDLAERRRNRRYAIANGRNPKNKRESRNREGKERRTEKKEVTKKKGGAGGRRRLGI